MMPRFGNALAHPCLVADIGGTNARFASVAEPGALPSPMVTLATSANADFADTVRQAIAEAGFPHPRSLLVAVAGPVIGRAATLTNARTAIGSLTIDGPSLAATLPLEQGLLLNDFEGLCLALPDLTADSLLPIGSPGAARDGPMLVVGPGTGLGVAALMVENDRLLPVASEAGHLSIGPQTPEDFALWSFFDETPTTYEDVLSGPGLTRLYQATARTRGQRQEQQSAAYVTASARDQTDPAAVQAAHHFMAILGRFAGDMALAFCSTGGVFISGGIAPRLSDIIKTSGFRPAFDRHGKAAGFLQPISTHLIMAPDAALQGLAAIARNPGRYQLDYATRLWNQR